MTNELYDYLLQKKEELALSFIHGAESTVVDSATVSLKPVSPNIIVIFAIAFLLAIFLGIGYVIYREFLSDRINSSFYLASDPEIFLLDEIVPIKKNKHTKLEAENNRNLLEKFRQSAEALGFFSETNRIKKLLITSFAPNEGKSFVCRNLAYALVLGGKKVVILDLEHPNFKTSHYFKIPLIKEIHIVDNSIDSIDELLNYDEKSSISIVNIDISPKDSRILGAGKDKLQKTLDMLSDKFDVILINVSDTKNSADALILKSCIDKTLLVVSKSKSSKSGITEFKNRMYRDGTFLNVIYNRT